MTTHTLNICFPAGKGTRVYIEDKAGKIVFTAEVTDKTKMKLGHSKGTQIACVPVKILRDGVKP